LSLKNDIEMVKEELSSEEKFFEKAVMTERVVKKYKKVIIGAVVGVTLFVAGSIVYSEMQDARVADANGLLLELKATPSNQAALARLASLSPNLHDVWLYSQAVATQNSAGFEKLLSSKAPFVADFAAYELAQATNDIEKLERYAQKQDAIYADLAIVQAALIFINSGETEKAHAKLKAISINSAFSEVASALMHYGVK